MSGKVTLKITEGPMAGKDVVFEEHDQILVGKSPECQVCLEDPKVSKHHFFMEVNPPDVCIRDMGSRNGTFVNDVKYGGRKRNETPDEGAKQQHPELTLNDGDVVRIGDTTLTIRVEISRYCCECGLEVTGSVVDESLGPDGIYTCPSCKAKVAVAGRAAKTSEPVRCIKCGREVSVEVGAGRHRGYICVLCKGNFGGIVKAFLELAKPEDQDLRAIQDYRVEEDEDGNAIELGRGGMGVVYLARKDKADSPERVDQENVEPNQFALKVMLPKVAGSPRAIAQFQREVEISRALRHTNVVRMREHGCSNGVFFFTLEYCDGGSVDKLMQQRGGQLSIGEAGRIILEVLEGLEYAHSADVTVTLKDGTIETVHGVVHRDLSPHNIFLMGSSSSQVAKVGDFGLAKAFETAGLSGNTRTGASAGKPRFIPRQQVVNFKYPKPEVDVWATAASLYNMLTGGFPRDFPEGKDPWRLVLTTQAVPIRERDPSIPKRLAKVIDDALIDEPDIKIKTAAELRLRLEGAL